MTFCFYFNPSKHSPISNVSVADRWTSWMVDLNVLNSLLQQGFGKREMLLQGYYISFQCTTLRGRTSVWIMQAIEGGRDVKVILSSPGCIKSTFLFHLVHSRSCFIFFFVVALFRMPVLIALLIKLMEGERSKGCHSFMTFIECIGNHMCRSV